jgi:uncharacterized membrane protein
MIRFTWENLSKEFRGTVLAIFGIILLLHTLNIFQKWLSWILILFSIAMIIYGFIEANLWNKIITLFQKIEKK